jgi:hypothetical protein
LDIYPNRPGIRLITPLPWPRPPTADVTANPSYSETLTINRDGSDSSDPGGNTPLTYLWDFGDGTTDETISATTSHTYATPGKYTVALTVRDSLGKLSAPHTIEVFPGDTLPESIIDSPASATLFRVREETTLSGSASDAEGIRLVGGLRPERLRAPAGRQKRADVGVRLLVGRRGQRPHDHDASEPDHLRDSVKRLLR